MRITKYIAALLLLALIGGMLVACDGGEVPTGMHDVTAPGEDYVLYVPMSWISNSRSGVSGAYYTTTDRSEVGSDLANHAKYWLITADKVEDSAESIDAYWEKLSAYYTSTWSDFKVIPHKEATEDKPEQLYRATALDIYGQDAGVCAAQVYTFTATVKEFAPTEDRESQGAMQFVRKYCQVIAMYQGEFFVLTYSAREEDYDTFIESFIADLPDETVVGEFVIKQEKASIKQAKLFKDPDTSDHMLPASTNEMPYRFYIPDTWTLGQTTEYPSATAPDGSTNVTVTIYVPSNDYISVDKYWEGYCLPEYEAVFDSFELSGEVTEGTVGVEKETKNAKTYTFRASVGSQSYRYAQTVIVHASLVYVITYTAKEADGGFDQYMNDYLAMLAQFTFR